MHKRPVRIISVHPKPGARNLGVLTAGGRQVVAALGRSGITRTKREGDGATPAARLRIVEVLYRPDRLPRPRTGLAVRPIRRFDGWCDAVSDSNYNRSIRLPFRASHEAMWRDDRLYDIVLVLDWNLTRRAKGRGSAIFFHLARPGLAPTAGCVAIPRHEMLRLLARLGARAEMIIR
jgi:L,D-peptidoglycan transpeptidase YkuD (ErfK/YbiS/YcfS/YnhG family)